MGELLGKILSEVHAVLDTGLAGAGTKGDPASFERVVELAAESFKTRELVLGAYEALADRQYGLARALAEVILAGNPGHALSSEAERILAEVDAAAFEDDDEIDRTEEDDALLVQDILYKTEIPEAVSEILESFVGNNLLDVSRNWASTYGGYLDLFEKLGFVRRAKGGGVTLTATGRATLRRLRPDLPEHTR